MYSSHSPAVRLRPACSHTDASQWSGFTSYIASPPAVPGPTKRPSPVNAGVNPPLVRPTGIGTPTGRMVDPSNSATRLVKNWWAATSDPSALVETPQIEVESSDTPVLANLPVPKSNWLT